MVGRIWCLLKWGKDLGFAKVVGDGCANTVLAKGERRGRETARGGGRCGGSLVGSRRGVSRQ